MVRMLRIFGMIISCTDEYLLTCTSEVDADALINLGLSRQSSSSSPENSDDFVLVPKNLPTDLNVINYERK